MAVFHFGRWLAHHDSQRLAACFRPFLIEVEQARQDFLFGHLAVARIQPLANLRPGSMVSPPVLAMGANLLAIRSAFTCPTAYPKGNS
jgi:hypothetical protein